MSVRLVYSTWASNSAVLKFRVITVVKEWVLRSHRHSFLGIFLFLKGGITTRSFTR